MLESGDEWRRGNRATLADILGSDFAPDYFIFEHEDFFSLACTSKSVRLSLKGVPLWLDDEIPEYVSILQPRVYRMGLNLRESSISFLKKNPKIVQCEVEHQFDEAASEEEEVDTLTYAGDSDVEYDGDSHFYHLSSALGSLPKLEYLRCHLLDIPENFPNPILRLEKWPKLQHLDIECHGGETIEEPVQRPVILMCPVLVEQKLNTLNLGSVKLTCEELVLPSTLRHLGLYHLTSKLRSLKLPSGLESLILANLPDLPLLAALPQNLRLIELREMKSSVRLDPLPGGLQELHLEDMPDLHLGALPEKIYNATFVSISSTLADIPSSIKRLHVTLPTLRDLTTLPPRLVDLELCAGYPIVASVLISSGQLEKCLPPSLRSLDCFGLSTGEFFRIPAGLTTCKHCTDNIVRHVICPPSLLELHLCCLKNVEWLDLVEGIRTLKFTACSAPPISMLMLPESLEHLELFGLENITQLTLQRNVKHVEISGCKKLKCLSFVGSQLVDSRGCIILNENESLDQIFVYGGAQVPEWVSDLHDRDRRILLLAKEKVYVHARCRLNGNQIFIIFEMKGKMAFQRMIDKLRNQYNANNISVYVNKTKYSNDTALSDDRLRAALRRDADRSIVLRVYVSDDGFPGYFLQG